MRRRKRCARFDIDKRLRGSCLHVWRHSPSTAGWPEEGLAHLCGYGARPPLTQERLSIRDGKLAYRMKRRLGDGHDLLILEPSELLRRLATLVPPPQGHLVRYHGVFGPASTWRREVIPPPLLGSAPAQEPEPQLTVLDAPEGNPQRSPDSRIPWSELLLRLFREDVLACPCGGRRKVIAFTNERAVIERILGHLGLPATGPPIAPAHSESSQWQDDVPALQQSLR